MKLQTIEQGSETLICISFTKLNIHLLLERVFLNFSGYSLTVAQMQANATKRLHQFRNGSHFSRDAKRIYEKTCYSHASSVVSIVTAVANWVLLQNFIGVFRTSNLINSSTLPLPSKIFRAKLSMIHAYEIAQWLEREFIYRKVHGSNPTAAFRLPLSRLGQPGFVLPSGGMAVRHRKDAVAERPSMSSQSQSDHPKHSAYNSAQHTHARAGQEVDRVPQVSTANYGTRVAVILQRRHVPRPELHSVTPKG
ncbi:hypothetical protein CSKR_111737 [Clonorchis sinensis]|uniref:Uncharacterized protein n=1 Tax=Clonorchis sinensis TaxID=79923 RepID=A0A419QEM3_CLOSI|nr:hypothetical protein CSKR_111737 [Clonorchis sinensis]